MSINQQLGININRGNNTGEQWLNANGQSDKEQDDIKREYENYLRKYPLANYNTPEAGEKLYNQLTQERDAWTRKVEHPKNAAEKRVAIRNLYGLKAYMGDLYRQFTTQKIQAKKDAEAAAQQAAAQAQTQTQQNTAATKTKQTGKLNTLPNVGNPNAADQNTNSSAVNAALQQDPSSTNPGTNPKKKKTITFIVIGVVVIFASIVIIKKLKK